ncbi:MAG TPA: arginine--tRNA ligase [Acidimicrobiales bacterium]|nr:arginine--tRNA ligase [Acidimicrobiales bacterium]
MPDPAEILAQRLKEAMVAALGSALERADPVLRRSDQRRFGDFQANAAMGLGKQLGRPPRQVAEAIVNQLDVGGVCSNVEVAGPGFINLTLDDDFLARVVTEAATDARLGVPTVTEAHTYVVDYAGPNVAKEMHVGHLRSSAIGDALARILGWLGHRVVRQDHLGDWGTQFGMLIEHLIDIGWDSGGRSSIGDLNELYRQAQSKFEGDAGFAERARRRVVLLQSGDFETVRLWEALVEESRNHFRRVYQRLGLTIGDGDVRPESFYNDMLDGMVEELDRKGILREDQGALCAFPAGFQRRDGAPLPLIVRKSDGGYGYAATDLAGVKYSVTELAGDRLVYVVDARQSQHFAMVFAVSTMAGWLGEGREAEHVAFGNILGRDGKPFRTRAGDTVKLAELLDEAVDRAAQVVESKSPDLPEAEKARVAEAVGVGAIKYNDLSNDRVKDYVFDWDRMLSIDGNTAPYLQYAHARIRSIFRRGDVAVPGENGAPVPAVRLGEPAERALALRLTGFGEATSASAAALQPHRLCGYLFDLAASFTDFYESCPVLRADSTDARDSRLTLCALTASTLRLGLGLLGIDAPDRM